MRIISHFQMIIFLAVLSIIKARLHNQPAVRAQLLKSKAVSFSSRINDIREWIPDLVSKQNPIVLDFSDHMKQSAKINLDLRQHFLKEQVKFYQLFERLHKAEEDLAVAKKKLRDIYSSAKESINNVKADMLYEFREKRFTVHKLDTKYELVKRSSEENQSNAEENLKRIQEQNTESKIQGNDAISRISNLMQTISQLVSNPIAGPMDLASVVPLLGL